MSRRDESIDQLRGLAMFWVVVVHVLYWGNFFSSGYINLLKSFCLFEMPLFFFVTGASNSFSKVDGYLNFVYKRYKRFLIPYWFYAVICAGLSIAYRGITNGIDVASAIKILSSWAMPVNRQITSISYLTWALWFAPVYLSVVLILPLLKRVKSSKYNIAFLFVLIALFCITSFSNMGWIQNVAFYSVWTYIGLFYMDIISGIESPRFRKRVGLTILIGIVILLALYLLGYPMDMQSNKFPPNTIFGVFSIVTMSLIVLAIPCVNDIYIYIYKRECAKRIADKFSRHSMTIFLYQAFAFNFTIRLSNFLIPGDSILASMIKSIICLITTVPICTLLAHIFGGVETIGTNLKQHK